MSGETKTTTLGTPGKPNGRPLNNMDEVLDVLNNYISNSDIEERLEELFENVIEAETGDKQTYCRNYIANYLINFKYKGISFTPSEKDKDYKWVKVSFDPNNKDYENIVEIPQQPEEERKYIYTGIKQKILYLIRSIWFSSVNDDDEIKNKKILTMCIIAFLFNEWKEKYNDKYNYYPKDENTNSPVSGNYLQNVSSESGGSDDDLYDGGDGGDGGFDNGGGSPIVNQMQSLTISGIPGKIDIGDLEEAVKEALKNFGLDISKISINASSTGSNFVRLRF